MPRTITLTTFFRPSDAAGRAVGPEYYLAGFEDTEGEQWGLAVPLEPNDVESAVLGTIAFSVTMELNGALVVEADGRGDAANEAIANFGRQARRPLDAVVREALDPKLLSMEDDVLEDLSTLRDRLANALRLVEDALHKEDERRG